jgi:hypothetical protein
MGRFRTLSPELLAAIDVATLQDGPHRLFTGLYGLVDDDGRCVASPAYLNGAIYWGSPRTAAEVAKYRDELVRRKLIKVYAVNAVEYLEIVGWRTKGSITYQVVNKYLPSRLPAPVGLPENDGSAPSLNGSGSGNEEEGEDEEEGEARVGCADDALRLASLLHDLIAANAPTGKTAKRSPEAREGRVADWAVEIDRLHRLDGIDWSDIETTLVWSQGNEFWQPIILSGKNLRDKFETLDGQRKRKPAKSAPGRVEPSDPSVYAKDAEDEF